MPFPVIASSLDIRQAPLVLRLNRQHVLSLGSCSWDQRGSDDSPRCRDLLVKSLLPLVQYYAYVEINARQQQELWNTYSEITELFPTQFAMKTVNSAADIFPVFHELFERKST